MPRVLALLLAVLAAPALQDPPPAEPAAESPAGVTCQRCDGKGKHAEPCIDCAGAGSVMCWRCASPFARPRFEEREEGRSIEEVAETFARLDALEAELAAKPIMEKLNAGRGPGMAACPAVGCIGGALFGAGECKNCEGVGAVPCPDCTKTKGRRACGPCSGEGSVVRACEDCAGAAVVPDPRKATDVSTCAWCDGTSRRPCVDCDEHGLVEDACWKCAGSGRLACKDCLGTMRVLCPDCGGEGRVVSPKNKKRMTACKTCKKKGRASCYACEKTGASPCDACDGDGRWERKCATCAGDRATPCMGCFRGRYHHWEATAELLASMGEHAQALRCWEQAERRVEPFWRARMKYRLDPVRTAEELEHQLELETERLHRLVELALERAR